MTDSYGNMPRSGHRAQNRSALRDALEFPEDAPLCLYDAELSEASVSRMWNKIQDPTLSAGRWGRSRPMIWWVAAACAALLSVFSWLRQPEPLALSGEREIPLGQIAASGSVERTLAFDDGSEIVLHEKSELSVLSNEGKSFVTALRSGKARFSVTPGGPRRWMVDAGELSVEVVGTVFVVERSARGTSVAVERGKVIVSGNVAGGKIVLTAGQEVQARPHSDKLAHVEESTPSASGKEVVRDELGARDASQPPAAQAEAPFEVTLEQLEREQLTQEEQAREPPVAPAKPTGTNTTSWAKKQAQRDLTQLLAEADQAKARGDTATAKAAFLRVVEESGAADPRKGIAAMSYVRLGSEPQMVVEVLRTSMSAIPSGLRESAWLRLVKAQSALGDLEGARASAQRCLAEFPEGRRREELEKLVALE